MKVNNIFYSISGEGIHAGIPTVFVRLAGCNLRCSYCDTEYAQFLEQGREVSIDEVVRSVRELRQEGWLLITGGEPLFQPDAVLGLVAKLGCAKRPVEVETNGSIDPPSWFKVVDSWSVDVKCPSSGSSYGTLRRRWLRRLRKRDQLKFVVGTEEDLGFVKGFLNEASIKAHVLVSPIIHSAGALHEPALDVMWLQRVAEFCKENNVRMSLQLHKIIWENQRGV